MELKDNNNRNYPQNYNLGDTPLLLVTGGRGFVPQWRHACSSIKISVFDKKKRIREIECNRTS